MEVTRYCKVCKTEIHPKRVALGYHDTCVNHSIAERYTGKVCETDTETYEVQIVRDSKVARELNRLQNKHNR